MFKLCLHYCIAAGTLLCMWGFFFFFRNRQLYWTCQAVVEARWHQSVPGLSMSVPWRASKGVRNAYSLKAQRYMLEGAPSANSPDSVLTTTCSTVSIVSAKENKWQTARRQKRKIESLSSSLDDPEKWYRRKRSPTGHSARKSLRSRVMKSLEKGLREEFNTSLLKSMAIKQVHQICRLPATTQSYLCAKLSQRPPWTRPVL